METLVVHPIVSIVATTFLLRWTLTSFEPNSPARPYLLLLLLGCTLVTGLNAHRTSKSDVVNSYIGFAYSAQLSLEIIDHVWHSKRYFYHEQPKLGKANKKSASPDFWILDVLWNKRRIGTPRQIRNVPQFDPKDPTYVPTRGWFLTVASIRLALSLLIVELLANPDYPDAAVRYGSGRTELIGAALQGRFSMQDFVDRVVIIMKFWVTTYLTQGLSYDAVSIMSVGLGINSVEDWPPRWGPVTSAYTVRRFWG